MALFSWDKGQVSAVSPVEGEYCRRLLSQELFYLDVLSIVISVFAIFVFICSSCSWCANQLDSLKAEMAVLNLTCPYSSSVHGYFKRGETMVKHETPSLSGLQLQARNPDLSSSFSTKVS